MESIKHLNFIFGKKDGSILSKEELNYILDSPILPEHIFKVIIDDRTLDKLSIGDILEKYEFFSEIQLQELEKYILSHIDEKSPLFMSDLIDCANWNNIENESIFEFCIKVIKNRRASSIVLSAILYIFEHMKIVQSDTVVPVFNRVINNKSYYQDCQIIAAFCLFRITMNPKYLQYIRETISLNREMYQVLRKKLLLMDYNNHGRLFYYKCNDFIKQK